MAPADVPGDFRIHLGSIQQSIDDVVVVLDIHVAGLECGFSSSEIYRDCVFRNRDRPEQPAVSDPRIEIVNLHVLHGTCEYVKSYEGKGTVMVASISADELAAHEAHIRFEGKVLGSLAVDGVSAHASNCRPSDEAVEVGDGARFKARAG